MRPATILLVLSLSATVLGEVVMDAAEVDMNGDPLQYPSFRLIADNTLGVTPLEDPRFKIDWTGNILGPARYAWSDPANPWYGAPRGVDSFIFDGRTYRVAHVFYPPLREFGFLFIEDLPAPEDPLDIVWPDEMTSIPVGVRLDVAYYFVPVPGDEIHLFASPARGEFTASLQTTVLYDYDERPQTVPEPASLSLLALGGLLIGRKRRIR